jgi:hypothetical protein
MRPKPWRVRVMRKIEAFVDVEATSVADAETKASHVPGVVHVFPQSAHPVVEVKLLPEHQAVVED